MRLLVVDDSKLVCARISRELLRRGIDCWAFASLAECTQCDPADLYGAILDLELEDATGVEVAAWLRSARASLPLVFFSSTTDAALRMRASALGDVFAKPHALNQVLEWAEHVTQARGRV